MNYRVTGTLSVQVVMNIDAADAKEAQRIAEESHPDVKQLNEGNSEEGWTFNDGFSIDVDEVEKV